MSFKGGGRRGKLTYARNKGKGKTKKNEWEEKRVAKEKSGLSQRGGKACARRRDRWSCTMLENMWVQDTAHRRVKRSKGIKEGNHPASRSPAPGNSARREAQGRGIPKNITKREPSGTKQVKCERVEAKRTRYLGDGGGQGNQGEEGKMEGATGMKETATAARKEGKKGGRGRKERRWGRQYSKTKGTEKRKVTETKRE